MQKSKNTSKREHKRKTAANKRVILHGKIKCATISKKTKKSPKNPAKRFAPPSTSFSCILKLSFKNIAKCVIREAFLPTKSFKAKSSARNKSIKTLCDTR